MSFSSLFKGKYHPLNTIEVSKSALIHNYQYLSQLSGLQIAPVLKSNAYGHGLVLVAKNLDSIGAPFFCVDSLYEAYELLKAGVKTHILIMGYISPDNLKVKKLPFSFAVYDKQTVAVLAKHQPDAGMHLFVDTGLHREGILLSELPEFLAYMRGFKNIKIEGLMSHFAASDQFNDPLTKDQVKKFQKALEILNKAGIDPQWSHIGNSAASLLPKYYKGKIGNLIRCGIATYGIGGEADDINLQPALRVQTTLGQIKRLCKGEKTGYDFTYTAKKDMTIGILPYGYYDGFDRRLSNNGYVLIEDIECPIVGRISMNISAVDISKIKNPFVGQPVTIYSNNISHKNSISKTAILAKTIQRDLLVGLSESTKRIVVK